MILYLTKKLAEKLKVSPATETAVDELFSWRAKELPVLLSGEGDAPPEDVGDPGGFADFLEVIADPEHEDYEHLTEWAKSQWWKPFDFEAVARRVSGRL